MEKSKQKNMAESLPIGILLSMVGGFLISYTYIARGGIFANAQTGNIVNLFMNLANGNFIKMFRYLIPLIAFAAGIFLTNAIKDIFIKNRIFHWIQIIVGLQIILLSIVGFIREGDGNMIANAMVSFVCAMQFEYFRMLNGNPITTVICTGNLRSGTWQLYQYIRTKDKGALNNALQYYAILGSFSTGVMIGTWVTNILRIKAVFITCLFLLITFILLFIKDNSFE